ncbi:MAG: ABC transporter ATP-binding protein [Acidobacteria bacterium]|nr:ABC transporter ATP-binding protein [Acidobacteriota bacterium]
MENIVEIEGLSKDYEVGFWRKRKVRALDDLSLSVKPGGIFGFLGGNGAGKTTTIKILMGLLFPTEGSAQILGSPIDDEMMRSRIGYCPENPYFYDYLTPLELLDYFGQLFGLDAAVRSSRSEELLNAVGLEEIAWKRQLRKFSKGMQQRVGLAQALINEPEIVFLDEPMSGLDPVGRREIRELIAGLKAKGTSVFMSTHILSDVEALCDEVAILRKGRLFATGDLQELLSRDTGRGGFEIIASGLSPAAIAQIEALSKGAIVSGKPNGIAIEVASDDSIEAVLRTIRDNSGTLISVLPVKQSLEDLFVETPAEN